MVLEVFLHVNSLVEVGVNDDSVLFFIHTEFFYTEINQFEFEFIEVNTVFHSDGEARLTVEEELQRALCTQSTAELREIRTDVSHCTHVVVCGCFHKDGDSVRTVSFVVNLLISLRRFVGRFLDGAVDIVFWHVLAFALLNQCTQTRVRVWVRTTLTGSNSDFFS